MVASVYKYGNFMAVSEYAAWCEVTDRVVYKWVDDGLLESTEDNCGVMLVERRRITAKYKQGNDRIGDKKRCGHCCEYLPLSEFSPSHLKVNGRSCRLCIKLSKNNYRGSDFAMDKKIMSENAREAVDRQKLPPGDAAERERRVQAHAARIEAMGLCGDGEDWTDE